MKRFAIFIVLSALAVSCGEDKEKRKWDKFRDDRDVDMIYKVVIEILDDECMGSKPAEGPAYQVDVFRRMDGFYDIRHNNYFIPGPRPAKKLKRNRGVFDVKEDYPLPYAPDTTHPFELYGVATYDLVDFVAKEKGRDDCKQASRVVGEPRPLGDPAELDGFYLVDYANWGYVCSQEEIDALSDEPEAAFRDVSNLDVKDDGGLMYWINNTWVFILDPLGESGVVDQEVILLNADSFSEFYAEVVGTVKPDRVELVMLQWAPYTTPEDTDCASLYTFVGQKRIPSLTAVDGDYGAHFDIYDSEARGTEDDPTEWTLEANVTLVDYGEVVGLRDPGGLVYLTPNGDTWESVQGSVEEGAMLTYSVTIAPPLVSYNAEFSTYNEEGVKQSSFRLTVEGHTRYLPKAAPADDPVTDSGQLVLPLIQRPPAYSRNLRPPLHFNPDQWVRSFSLVPGKALDASPVSDDWHILPVDNPDLRNLVTDRVGMDGTRMPLLWPNK
jgi:hypothetical protein